jgi:PAS domain-containing protein
MTASRRAPGQPAREQHDADRLDRCWFAAGGARDGTRRRFTRKIRDQASTAADNHVIVPELLASIVESADDAIISETLDGVVTTSTGAAGTITDVNEATVRVTWVTWVTRGDLGDMR